MGLDASSWNYPFVSCSRSILPRLKSELFASIMHHVFLCALKYFLLIVIVFIFIFVVKIYESYIEEVANSLISIGDDN